MQILQLSGPLAAVEDPAALLGLREPLHRLVWWTGRFGVRLSRRAPGRLRELHSVRLAPDWPPTRAALPGWTGT